MTTLRGTDDEVDNDKNDEDDEHEGGDDVESDDEDEDDNDGRMKGIVVWGIVPVWVQRGKVTSIGLSL